MKQYTTKEIVDKCQSIWDEVSKTNYIMGWEKKGCIDVDVNTPELIKITIGCMYEAPPINLGILMQLAEFFGTMNINDDDRFANSGCETCDYGSSYGFTLSIRPEAGK